MTALAIHLSQAARGVDRVLLAIVGIFLTFAALVPQQALDSLYFMMASLLNVAPFLFLSIAVAAFAKASGADNLIARAFLPAGCMQWSSSRRSWARCRPSALAASSR